jgi:LmbE family N-acetylglucosaminyl deacetylase
MTNRWGGVACSRNIPQKGVHTYYVCPSRGERGWFGPEEENPSLERLGQFRTKDLENAVNELAMEGTFYRAFSPVDSGRKSESDLFEGIH